MLVRLMETFLRYELKQMKNDNELNQLVTTLKNNEGYYVFAKSAGTIKLVPV